MANVKQISKTFKYGLLMQTDWATPQAAGANFKTIPYDAGYTLFDPGVRVNTFQSSGTYGIHKEKERSFVDGRQSLARINFRMPADVKTIAPHWEAALFAISENAGSPYQKNITSGGLSGVVDFNGDDTTLYTLCQKNQASADDGIIAENCIIDNLVMSFDFPQKGKARFLQLSGSWVSNEMNFEQTTNGTWTTTTFTPMGNTDTYTMVATSFTADGVDISAEVVRGFTLEINNNIEGTSTASGKANQYDIEPIYTSKILLNYNDTTEKILKDFQDGAAIEAFLGSSLGAGVLNGASIHCVNGILQSPPFMFFDKYAGVQLDVLWQSAAGATPITLVVSDGIDWGY